MTVSVGDLCKELKNYFIKEVHLGDFTIKDGSITLDFLQEGQYFCIAGSVFNDGVYTYPAENLTDELYNGAVWAMAVPKAVMALLSEINDYQASLDEKKDIVNSPFQSESFGGYSYSKSGSGTRALEDSGADEYSWQGRFKNRLNAWRKARVL